MRIPVSVVVILTGSVMRLEETLPDVYRKMA